MNFINKINAYSVVKNRVTTEGSVLPVSNLPKRGLLSGLMIVILLLIFSCQEKSHGQTSNLEKDGLAVSMDSLKPNVNIKVNRHYDDKGDLIGYDSTYSSFYSTIEGDTARMDSVIRGFDTFFSRHHSSDFDRQFNSLFFYDSLRHYDFFSDDFFRKRYELNESYLLDMMQRMDSIKNHYFQKGMIPDSKPN